MFGSFQEQHPVVTPWYLDLMGTMRAKSKIPTWRTGKLILDLGNGSIYKQTNKKHKSLLFTNPTKMNQETMYWLLLTGCSLFVASSKVLDEVVKWNLNVTSVFLRSYTHLDIYTGLNSNLNRQHHRLESRYSSSSGGSYEEEKSEYINITVLKHLMLLLL